MRENLHRLLINVWRLRWLIIANLFLISPVIINESGKFISLYSIPASVLWLLLVHSKAKEIWKLHLLLLPIYVIVSVELFLIFNMESRLSSSFISIFLGQFHHLDEFISLKKTEILVSLVIFIPGYWILISRLRSVEFYLPKHVLKVSIAGLVVVYSSAISYGILYHNQGFSGSVVGAIAADRNSPFGFLSQSYTSYSVYSRNELRRDQREGFSFGAKSVHEGKEIHVLIIGESSRPDHWQINGYERKTTPLLSKKENIISYPDAISEVAITSLSVPLIITRDTIEKTNEAEKSVVSAFAEAGYHTSWLSNVQVDNFSGEISDFAVEADIQFYHDRTEDAVLLNDLDDIINEHPEKKLFIVMHTQGSHFDYKRRYPEQFKHFSLNQGSKKERLINQYDDSIVYTDYFLNQIISRLDNTDGIASLLYISDHGENLYDDDRNLLGHFFNNEYDLPTAMLFWGSNKFKDEKSNIFKSLKRAQNFKLSTKNIFPTMLDIGGVTIPSTDMSLSIGRIDFKPNSRYVLQKSKVINYDEWLSSHAEN